MTEEIINKILKILNETYPDAATALRFSSVYELLVAVMLSAQCTDERVNKVTAELFLNQGTPEKMLELSETELEKIIFSCGLYHTKAKHILSASKDIIEKFGGQVPCEFEDLLSLDGVGRKTADVVYSVGFHGDAIAVDTHVQRVANRIGLARSLNPLGTEKQLMAAIPKNLWSKAHHLLIFHGRKICSAAKPQCGICPIEKYCEKNNLKR